MKKLYTIHFESTELQSKTMDEVIEAIFRSYKNIHPKIKYSISIKEKEKEND